MVQAGGGGGVMVWRIFSWHTFGPLVQIEHRLYTTAYLSIVADHVHPFMTTVYPSSDGFFQQDNAPCHKAQIISDWFLEHDNVHFTQMASTITRSQSNRAPLGCGGTGDLHHVYVADKSAATAWCYHVNMDQNLWEMFPKELRQFWRQKVVQPGTSKLYLIKWPVSVYIYILRRNLGIFILCFLKFEVSYVQQGKIQ